MDPEQPHDAEELVADRRATFYSFDRKIEEARPAPKLGRPEPEKREEAK